jgi:DNA-binding response OmpR family regulator
VSRSATLRFDLRSDKSQQSYHRSDAGTAAGVYRILVIYGDPDSRRVLNQVLAPAYDVVAVPYFPTVIAGIFSPTKPDLVILDIGLAGKPVQDLCRQIRKESQNVPLFVLGSDESADKVLMLDLGADDYITKPIDTTEFLARVRTRVRWWTGQAQ